MQKHVKTYLQYFDIGDQDIVKCEACSKPGHVDNGFDIHHIYGRVGKLANDIKNLILLCRKCHDKAHASVLSKSELQYIHNNVLAENRKTFVK